MLSRLIIIFIVFSKYNKLSFKKIVNCICVIYFKNILTDFNTEKNIIRYRLTIRAVVKN